MQNRKAAANFGLLPLFLVLIIVFFFGGMIVIGILEDYKNSNQKTPDIPEESKLLKGGISESEESSISQKRIGEITEKADEIAEQQIEIPEKFKLREIAKILFKIDSPAPLNLLIIAGMLFIIFYALFADIFETFSPFGKGTSVAIGICVTLIAGILGIIKSASVFLINIGSNIKYLEKYGAFGQFFIITMIIIFWVILAKILKKIKIEKNKEKSDEIGTKIGTDVATSGFIRRAYEKIANIFGEKEVPLLRT